jgi:hypothetical protein
MCQPSSADGSWRASEEWSLGHLRCIFVLMSVLVGFDEVRTALSWEASGGHAPPALHIHFYKILSLETS